MKKQGLSLLLLSICIALVLLPSSSAQTRIELPNILDVNLAESTSQYYVLDISNLRPWLNIAVSSTPQDGSASPKIFLSKHNTNPSESSSDYALTPGSINTIIIPRSDIQGQNKLYVGVICGFFDCKSTLRFETIKELSINANGEKKVQTVQSLDEANAAVVRVRVPQNDHAERIVFHVDAIPNKAGEVPELLVYINRGRDVPDTIKGVSIPRTSWSKGTTIVIYKHTNLFCTGCEYTLYLKFNHFSAISIEAHVFETLTDLGGSSKLDGANKDKVNFYKLQVPKERNDEEILIEVNPQIGSQMVYLDCNQQPSKISAYYWRYHIDGPQDIIMTAREQSRCKTGIYYVAVSAQEPTVYSIRAISKKASKLYIEENHSVVGDLFPQEKISYEISMPLSTVEKIVIKLDTKSEIGIKITNCRFPTECPGLLPGNLESHFKTPEIYTSAAFTYKTQKTETGKRFEIEPLSGGCYPILLGDPVEMDSSIPSCAYKITLSSSFEAPVEYAISAQHEDHQRPSIPSVDALKKEEGSGSHDLPSGRKQDGFVHKIQHISI